MIGARVFDAVVAVVADAVLAFVQHKNHGCRRHTRGMGSVVAGTAATSVDDKPNVSSRQNALPFKDSSIDDIYTVCELLELALELELAAAAALHLTEQDFEALEASIACGDRPASSHSGQDIVRQRQKNVNLYNVLAGANPYPFLRFGCEIIWQLIELRNDTPQVEHERFGLANVKIRKAITKAARGPDAAKVRVPIVAHMIGAPRYAKWIKSTPQGRPVLDSEIRQRVRAHSVAPVGDTAQKGRRRGESKGPGWTK
ncbi:DNA-binding FadR family transcriptional regulator [Paraburkholderia sp. BL23I1N1]|uniref:hypothetical protein n=1 Tax=Paraburkholderia sp. BL23I1N1 TaxID=1938802 RepID=UPI000FF4BE0C|nr:hypothetical protein [Paraburkholderia sp. BL23I1N1]RKE40162.1 DNA-binding FadR family transcriptional regulator [Paraburkholderia sp. BL23I1N1]